MTSRLERGLAAFTELSHRNYRPKSEEFAQFVGTARPEPKDAESLLQLAKKASSDKMVFLAAMVGSLWFGAGARELWEVVRGRLGTEYLVAMSLHLGILRKALNSPRGGPLIEHAGARRPAMLENVRNAEAQLRALASESGVLEHFLDRFLDVPRNGARTGAPLSLGILLDDMNPQPTATLSKMVFDQIAVLLQHTPHSITIVASRLHAPRDEFWTPGVHQTRMIPLEEYMERYDLPSAEYAGRVSLVGLNQHFFPAGAKTQPPRKFDAFFCYPFRHSLVEPLLHARAPMVEVEIMSGVSNAAHCDVVIPNGIPGEAFLREHFSKVILLQPPRRRFKGAANDGLPYLEGVGRFVVSAGKDFDKRASLDVGEFVARIADYVRSVPGLSWVFVGGSPEFTAQVTGTHEDLVKARRLVCVGYEPDLPALFSRAELYVQPPIVGGGRAPAIAIENECPAVSMQFGDCTRYMPFGCQAKDLDDLLRMVRGILEDPNSRAKTMAACRAVVAPGINEEAAITFDTAARRAQVKFAVRSALMQARESGGMIKGGLPG